MTPPIGGMKLHSHLLADGDGIVLAAHQAREHLPPLGQVHDDRDVRHGELGRRGAGRPWSSVVIVPCPALGSHDIEREPQWEQTKAGVCVAPPQSAQRWNRSSCCLMPSQ